MVEITLGFLRNHHACAEAVEAWKERGCESDPIKVFGQAMAIERYEWANWVMVRILNRQQLVHYAVFAAELVLGLYETLYPNDDRPRKAIEAAKEYLKNPTYAVCPAAHAAADSAADAARAAYAARAAHAAAYAAHAAAYAARAADAAAYAVSPAAADAADAAAYAAYAADAAHAGREVQERIIEYGITLLGEADG